MKYFYPFAGFCAGLTAAPFSLFILNGTSSSKIENAKHVEVFFYGKNNTSKTKRSARSIDTRLSLTSSDTSTSQQNNVERIKVWIEDLNNFSKFEYCSLSDVAPAKQSSESTQKCTWKNFITLDQDNSEASKKTKYYFLAKLARYFLLVQHNLNLLKGLNIEKNNWNLNFDNDCKSCEAEVSDKCCIPCKKCSKGTEEGDCKCCKDHKECFIPCCLVCNEDSAECKCKCEENKESCKKNFETNQKKFYFSLKNLTGIATNKYLTALQAHINLLDIDLSSDLSNIKIESESSDDKSSQKKNLNATLIYGFTDYYYKVSEEMPDISTYYEKITKQKLNNGNSDSNNKSKKYFVNIPHQFSFTVSGISNGDSKENSSTDNKNDLVDLYKKLNEKQEFLDTFKRSNLISPEKTSDAKKEEENINCLLKKNFVFLVESLENGKCFVDCKTVTS